MMRKQRGVTMIGWIFLLIPVAVVATVVYLIRSRGSSGSRRYRTTPARTPAGR